MVAMHGCVQKRKCVWGARAVRCGELCKLQHAAAGPCFCDQQVHASWRATSRQLRRKLEFHQLSVKFLGLSKVHAGDIRVALDAREFR